MHHFFVPKAQIYASGVIFPDDTAHQIKRVLRLREGDQVNVLDNQGNIFLTGLAFGEGHSVSGKIISSDICDSEPALKLSLYIGLTQRDKFEWILQKGTELGVSRYIPFISERSLVQKAASAEKKEQRWQKIIQEAAEQCKRGRIPILEPVMNFNQAVAQAAEAHEISLIPWEESKTDSIKTILSEKKVERIALMIGPEGGFSADEVQFAMHHKVIPITLGKRILRMETAALAAAALVLFISGEME